MLLHCPYCGPRSNEEFTHKGDASVRRPAGDAGPEAHFRHVYIRDNPRGRYAELWHHTGGCRAWLIVERDTQTHEIFSVTAAKDRQDAPAGDGAQNGGRP